MENSAVKDDFCFQSVNELQACLLSAPRQETQEGEKSKRWIPKPFLQRRVPDAKRNKLIQTYQAEYDGSKILYQNIELTTKQQPILSPQKKRDRENKTKNLWKSRLQKEYGTLLDLISSSSSWNLLFSLPNRLMFCWSSHVTSASTPPP